MRLPPQMSSPSAQTCTDTMMGSPPKPKYGSFLSVSSTSGCSFISCSRVPSSALTSSRPSTASPSPSPKSMYSPVPASEPKLSQRSASGLEQVVMRQWSVRFVEGESPRSARMRKYGMGGDFPELGS
ncbi:MAG: hypothetical protein QM765_25170 [Myxococcales bacterium]